MDHEGWLSNGDEISWRHHRSSTVVTLYEASLSPGWMVEVSRGSDADTLGPFPFRDAIRWGQAARRGVLWEDVPASRPWTQLALFGGAP